MSVYRPANSRRYHYDFQFRGQRYHGSTGCESKTAAKEFERRRRHEAALGSSAKPPITLDEAAGLWWQARGRHHANAATEEGQLDTLTGLFGKTVLLGDLTFDTLERFISKRRAMKAKGRDALISNATCNREIELLRRVCRYVEETYEVARIEWGKHLLKEPPERVRELWPAEEASLFEALDGDLAAVVEFAMLSGQRRTAVITLLWSKVDLVNARAEVLTKGGVWHKFPLSPRMVAIIANRPKVCAQIFTYVCERPSPPRGDRPRRLKGERYPFSKQGWYRKWRKALKDAGIDDFRFHDLRHTAGSRITRSSGNIKVAQRLLGHTNISTTSRYAHVIEEDVRQALLAADSRNSPEGNPPVGFSLLVPNG
jgi:integrase